MGYRLSMCDICQALGQVVNEDGSITQVAPPLSSSEVLQAFLRHATYVELSPLPKSLSPSPTKRTNGVAKRPHKRPSRGKR